MPIPATRDQLLNVIARRAIPPGQITLYKALYEAPAGLSKSQLATSIRENDEESLSGVLGALGKRVNQTPEFELARPGFELLLERDEHQGQIFYRLRPEVREVIEGLPKLREAMALPVEAIHEVFGREESWLIV